MAKAAKKKIKNGNGHRNGKEEKNGRKKQPLTTKPKIYARGKKASLQRAQYEAQVDPDDHGVPIMGTGRFSAYLHTKVFGSSLLNRTADDFEDQE